MILDFLSFSKYGIIVIMPLEIRELGYWKNAF